MAIASIKDGGCVRFLVRLLRVTAAVFAIGVLNTPAIGAGGGGGGSSGGGTPVPVDQQPLTVRPQIPPDITLMLDDSGSMAWDYMPDACYLNGVTCTGTDNGTNPNNGQGVDYIQSIDNNALIDSSNNGVYYNPAETYAPPVHADGTSYPNATGLTSAWLDGFNQSSGSANLTRYSTSDVTGEYGSDSSPLKYSSSVKSGSTTYHYFQFSTGAAAGPYTVYYVATASQGCGTQSNCYLDTDTSGTVAPSGVAAGQNIANWFAYYHTRILMAKSGLMTAFSGLDPKFRVGFGSIDGNNNSGLPSAQWVNNAQTIATVAPFGSTTDTSSQRINFWNWVAGESANHGTPLRQALDQVGQYYQTAQPWTNMSSDPVQPSSPIACRQAYTILTTDGFWNEDSSLINVGNADGTDGTTVTGPNGQTYTYKKALPYSDSRSNTLADVAMKYWETDLRANIDNEVPPAAKDPAFWQHMVTFTMGLGFTPVGIEPAGTSVDQIFGWANGGTAISNFKWPQPAANSLYNIADLAHAGVNGHGGFYSATSPQSFTSALQNALKRATERVGTGASLAANSTQLQTGTAVFQANYYTTSWKGDLKSIAVNSATGAIASTPTWSAVAAMPPAANRKIWTYNTATGAFVAFKNASGALPALSAAQLAALDPGGTGSAANEMAVIDYLRGDASQEQKNGGNLRSRDWVLGDIVDSQPVYSGAPNANEFINQNFAGYSYDPNNANASVAPFHAWAVGTTDNNGNFTASTVSQRTPLVFAAANDGMLHAFDASSGAEVYAYLPGALMVSQTDPFTGMSEPFVNLTNPGYGAGSYPHQFYNDGELTIADAYVDLGSGAAWHTILVGTTGRGPARAVYALDVTDPTAITPLWERYAGDSSSLDSNSGYIGEMVGKPVIAQTGDYGTSPAWSVLIGNGYNSPRGVAALLQFDLATGALYVHQTDSQTSNGLAAPVAWRDYPTSGMNDVAYAGDLLGRLWSFPLITVSTSNHGGSSTTSYTPSPSSVGTKLFTAANASGAAQAITAGMLAGLNPKDNSVWVFFGTGKYLTQADVANTSVQSWYGIRVQSSPGGSQITTSNRSSLVQRQIVAEQAGSASPFQLPVRAVTSAPSTSDMSGKNGWFMDLVSPNPNGVNNPTAQGERMVVPDQFQGNLLLGATRIPQPSGANTDPCNPAGGGWIMAVDPFTGTNPSTNFFDTNGDGLINGGDTITVNGQQVPAAGVGFNALPNAPIFVGGDMLVSFDNGTTSNVKTAGSSGGYKRVSWQEMVNP